MVVASANSPVSTLNRGSRKQAGVKVYARTIRLAFIDIVHVSYVVFPVAPVV